jgi:hypothetical protein
MATTTYTRRCEECGVEYVATREHSRFCTPSHRVKWHRKHDEPQTHRPAADRGNH